jgi:hypothetical protein
VNIKPTIFNYLWNGKMEEKYSDDPKMKYIQLAFYGHEKGAIELKFSIIPQRLFRFQPPKNNRFKTIENKQLFLSPSSEFDDPFDMIGTFCDFIKISNEEQRSVEDCIKFIKELNESRQTMPSVCFCENINNLPLWASYTNNYQGFAVEYNFCELGMESHITRNLYPIYYEPRRIDLTKSLINILKNKDSVLRGDYSKISKEQLIIFFSNFCKHESWKFQDEWRLINISGERVLSEIVPEAIYIGYKSSPFTKRRLKNIAKKISCKCFLMKESNLNEDKYNLQFEQIV